MVLDLIAHDGLAIEIFTLDTGRLPKETHDLIAKVRKHYGLAVKVYSPWPESVDALVEAQGVDGFYEGVDQRKACCRVRKVEPLRRALAGKRSWITGLRREQADSRADVAETELDPVHGLWKFNPLADWTDDDVWAVPARQQRPLQRAARSRLPLDRLRALHPRRSSRASIRAPAAGGGSRTAPARNAGCTRFP